MTTPRPDRADVGAAVAIILLLAALAPSAASGSFGQTPGMRGTGGIPAFQGWGSLNLSSSPPAVGGGMLAFSSAADEFVLFGGATDVATNTTWVLDLHGTGWTQRHPVLSPPARADGMLVYDSAADAFVLFGGWHQRPDGTYLRWGDTWVFYLGNDTWVPRHPAMSPSPRSDAAIAYDPGAAATFLVGGFNGTAYLADEWAYTFANDSWWPRPAPVMPSRRADGRMVYDPGTDAFYLYGGNDFSGPNFTYHHLGDTWTYSWSDRRWTLLTPAVAPGALDYAVLAADPRSGVLLMNGGFGASVVLGDTWAFNTTRDDWAQLVTPTSPPPRMAAVGGYDALADQFVIFSGGDVALARDDTWLLDYPATLEAAPSASTTVTSARTALDFTGRMVGGTGFLAAASWSFGDGATANGTNASHAFASPGAYTVLFQITDQDGRMARGALQITVGAPWPAWASLAAIGVSAAVAVAALVTLRRRRARTRRPPDPRDPGASETVPSSGGRPREPRGEPEGGAQSGDGPNGLSAVTRRPRR